MNVLAVVVYGDSMRVSPRAGRRSGMDMSSAIRYCNSVRMRDIARAARAVVMNAALVHGDVVTMRAATINSDSMRMRARA